VSQLRALVCDDDSGYRLQVRDLLEQRGVEVLEASDGQDAMNLFVKESVDLVVTDFLMPKIDGLQVIRNIRLSGEHGRQVPIILMSAISRTHIDQEHSGFEPDYYINKPFKNRKMAKLLDRVIEQARARSGRNQA